MTTKIKDNYYIVILICCCLLTGLVHGLEGGTSGSFYKPIADDLNLSISSISLYVTLKGISMVLFTPLANKFIRRYKLNLVLSLSILIYIGALFGLSISNNLYQIYSFAIVMGLGASFLSTIIVPYLINNWFFEKQGLVLGIAFGFSGLTGALLGPIISSHIASFGWRSGYRLLTLIIGSVLLPLILFLVKENPNNTFKAYKIKTVSTKNNQPIDENVLRQYLLSKSFRYSFLFGVSLALSNGILFNLPTYARSIGQSLEIGALATSLTLLGATIGKVLFGHLNDKLKASYVVLVASISGAVGLIFIYLFGSNTILLLLGSLLYGAIVSLMTLEPPIIVKQVFGEHYYYDLFVYINMATQLFYALGPTIYALIFDSFNSYFFSFLLCLIFTILSFPLCYMSIKTARNIKKEAI